MNVYEELGEQAQQKVLGNYQNSTHWLMYAQFSMLGTVDHIIIMLNQDLLNAF